MVEVNDSQPAEVQKRQYDRMVSGQQPRPNILRNIFWAFVIGGLICVVGQLFINLYSAQGFPMDEAISAASATLILIAGLLTGLGYYDEITKIGGAGGIVPITGFANAMVSPAMEYRTEGLIMGVGAKLFSIAGPVLIYGIITSWIVGLIYYFII